MEFFLERLDKKEAAPVCIAAGAVSIGRHPGNTITLPAEDKCVSGYHALIYADAERLLLQDMQSTNGTYVNGKQIQERVVKVGDEIALGMNGPKYRVRASEGADAPERPSGGSANVSSSVTSRPSGADRYDIGFGDDSDVDVLSVHPPLADRHANKKPASQKMILATITVVTAATLIFLLSFAFCKPPRPPSPSQQRSFFSISGELPPGGIDDITASPAVSASSVEEKINAVLLRFGEKNYSASSDMIDRVEYYLKSYSGPMKRSVAMCLARRKKYFPMIRRVFTEKNIPLDLAYVSIIESGLDPNALSHAGAKGLWQFMPKTARAYGLEVSDQRDERTDPEKSTYAAAAYFSDLIAIFGSKRSVMLCMAAYNAGEYRVMNALRRIEDPVNNRDFWYLYRMGWLPQETNEYIPKILAMIIISENSEEYGFKP